MRRRQAGPPSTGLLSQRRIMIGEESQCRARRPRCEHSRDVPTRSLAAQNSTRRHRQAAYRIETHRIRPPDCHPATIRNHPESRHSRAGALALIHRCNEWRAVKASSEFQRAIGRGGPILRGPQPKRRPKRIDPCGGRASFRTQLATQLPLVAPRQGVWRSRLRRYRSKAMATEERNGSMRRKGSLARLSSTDNYSTPCPFAM